MRSVLALLRASWLSATSYRLRIVISFFGLIFTVVPLFFVARALDPMVANSIQAESDSYFSFILVGMVMFTFVSTATMTLPGTISSGITTGTLEALISTRTRLPALLLGMMAFPLLWTGIRGGIMLLAGSFLGAQFVWSGLPAGMLIVALIVLAHIPFSIVGAAMILAFRTAGPLGSGVLFLSGALGGVYYATTSIPSWLQSVSDFMPLTYGLRALRQVLLLGEPLSAVAHDLTVLCGLLVLLLLGSVAAFVVAFRYARKAGTLAQY